MYCIYYFKTGNTAHTPLIPAIVPMGMSYVHDRSPGLDPMTHPRPHLRATCCCPRSPGSSSAPLRPRPRATPTVIRHRSLVVHIFIYMHMHCISSPL